MPIIWRRRPQSEVAVSPLSKNCPNEISVFEGHVYKNDLFFLNLKCATEEERSLPKMVDYYSFDRCAMAHARKAITETWSGDPAQRRSGKNSGEKKFSAIGQKVRIFFEFLGQRQQEIWEVEKWKYESAFFSHFERSFKKTLLTLKARRFESTPAEFSRASLVGTVVLEPLEYWQSWLKEILETVWGIIVVPFPVICSTSPKIQTISISTTFSGTSLTRQMNLWLLENVKLFAKLRLQD